MASHCTVERKARGQDWKSGAEPRPFLVWTLGIERNMPSDSGLLEPRKAGLGVHMGLHMRQLC